MKCFVIMPFGNPKVDAEGSARLDLVYDEWIRPTVESVRIPGNPRVRLTCHRADKDNRSGEIIRHIIEQLLNADIVIADLSGRNPNVFYELGVRHALGKRTLLIADSLEDIPFDLRGLRAIPYEYEPRRLVNFGRELKAAIETAVNTPDSSTNPVRQFLLERQLERIQSAGIPAGYDVITELLSEMKYLKETVRSQTADMRRLAIGISSPEASAQTNPQLNDHLLSSLEGVWGAQPTRSLVCARMVDGELLAPYCFGGDHELNAHYFNFRRFGRTIFARFDWFKEHYSGYCMFKVVSKDKLVGGWWYDGSVPGFVRRGKPTRGDDLSEMRPNILVRLKGKRKFPGWAEAYFDGLKSGH